MTNEELYKSYVGHLRSKLSNQITDEFKKEFLDKLEAKRNTLYLQDEELALNMAQFCNMAGKLTFPLYFDDKITVVDFDNGFNYVNIDDFSYMDSIIKSGRFALYKLEHVLRANYQR